jgi:hypothetical protein
MTAPLLAFPGGRKLAGWWRQLARFRPQRLWVAHFILHKLEALVRITQSRPLDPFTAMLLKALAARSPAPGPRPGEQVLNDLDSFLHLGRQVLGQALRALGTEGLVRATPDGSWALTPLGRHALEHRAYSLPRYERQVFYFVDRPADRPALGPGFPTPPEPHFLALHNSGGAPWPVAEGAVFDVRVLEACLGRPAEWKLRHGFPPEVQEVVGVGPAARGEAGEGNSPPAWQRVMVDRPERFSAALVLVGAEAGGVGRPAPGAGRLIGFPVRPDGWVLATAEPLFAVDEAWAEVFPELAAEPAPELWRRAWQSWCEPRDLPAGEVNACVLERRGERLRVTAPASMIERLRAARSDALKGETWLLAGEGPTRAAALVELAAAGLA